MSLTRGTLTWLDYFIFILTLSLSLCIGLYFGCFGRQTTLSKYLMGGNKLRSLPVAISLVACHISSVTMLALPADVYRYGASYFLVVFSMIILSLTKIYVFLPVFYNLHVTSVNEYLEKRFDTKTRLLASFLYLIWMVVYLPVAVYIPSLAFTTVSGIDIYITIPIVCSICIIYTTLGGLKSVIWNDIVQMVVMLATLFTVLSLGLKLLGPRFVWTKAKESGRLDIFDFDPDPTKRDSFWTLLIGCSVFWITVIYFAIGMSLINCTSVFNGLILTAKYADCDPIKSKQIRKNDELVPYFILNLVQHIPGLFGLFFSGVFSAALSTLSTHLNSSAALIYKDLVIKFFKKSPSEEKACNVVKTIVVVQGVITTILVLIIDKIGGLFEFAIGSSSVALGVQLGVFTLGVLFPKANSNGAFYGGVFGIISVLCIFIPSKIYEFQKITVPHFKPMSTENCDFLNHTNVFVSNSTVSDVITKSQMSQTPAIFRISFYYYSLIGAVVTIIAGIAISYVRNNNTSPVDKSLISPVCYFLLHEEIKDCATSKMLEAEYQNGSCKDNVDK